MSLLRLTFLGTSAAQPTLHRNLSGLAVKAHSDLLLFDCGEGSQRQMVRYGTGFTVDAVFFTHFHADHYLGIIGFLRTLGMTGRSEPIHLYGPPSAKRLLHQAVHLGVESMSFPVEIHELKDGDVVPRKGYAVHAVGVDHRINALGYALVEDDRPGRFNLDVARSLGVPEGPSFGKLQRGEPVTLEDGRTVKPEDVLGAPRPGRRLVISGDTRPCPALVKAAKDADLLVHESTFSDDEQERAVETRHSTAREAARVAREAGARRLVLTHLSSRHDTDPSKLLTQAREEYQGPVEVAFDGFTVELPLRD
ncbi:ribonuclease Z [Myxococcus xanthus DK 1622]|uniref:Ribonuclease Z n=3 Tax=Myxococcus TaxID=32 RepID=RNZ_MYXXD|nr:MULTISPECIES: ribonuclease Z [Myxococcus]Q1DEJ2.1 RecName: Full=Ribonuclease Z; Short=RNase Z; AltName: Full=tRNA 3 endonuclease; AltName: Full=tRNase Z [Myxococcus xanthus DK 1622]ABF88454.1 ribonuclease Z [Myxococcus xanthus DK 1622]NOJ55440.1 ribonuclease Z [Myxococcus xanthus]NOJ77915.1 ribonuclease Z [Myxococcus xanthus]NOJ86174.1 ribonuclease Z [Myxococcus xanthus]QPM80349.1 ribonuclease Z [Myxococcus xanthus]